MRITKNTTRLSVIPVAICLIIGMLAAVLGQQDGNQVKKFTGSYQDLTSAQTRLINDWVERYAQVTGKDLDPEETFNGLALSFRTTFEAVTHALMTSELSDESGNSLGTPLDVIEHVDAVRGQIKGARGDNQFRIYCRLKPGSRDILERAREFVREGDNHHYHKGYPLNYRQLGGVPSIQISMALDEISVDIDVDYRSSKIPAALINGHLTSANSDVRAGDNYEKHNSRWTGLGNWWANWFSLPFVKPEEVTEQDKERAILDSPPKGRGKIEEAAYDFFNSWLVEGQPEVAMSYVSLRAFECQRTDPAEPFDLGMAPFQMLTGMRRANEQLGKPARLEDVLTGIRVARRELKVVKQPHHAAFVLYEVAESKAFEFDCTNRWKPSTEVKKGSDSKFGDYFATGLHINATGNRGGRLILLWEKEGDNWRIVSYKAEPDPKLEAPDLRAALAAGTIPRVSGNPEQIAAAHGFLKAWFLEKDLDQALSYVAEECFECINLYLPEGEETYQDADELKSRVRLGLERTAGAFSEAQALSAIMSGIEPVNSEVRIVNHADEVDYTISSVPDYLAASYGCGYRLKGGKPLPRPENPNYGNYYVQAFKSKTFTGESAVLALLWGPRSGGWKILALHLVLP